MICDTHVHLAPMGFTESLPPKNVPAYQEVREMSAEVYLKIANEAGISCAVVFPHIFPEISAASGTRYIMEKAERYPDRFVPFLRIDEDIKVIDELSPRIKGIKEQFLLTKHIDIEKFFPTYELMQDKGLVLISHPATSCRISRMSQIADNFPNLKIILAHSGRVFNAPRNIIAREVGRELQKYPNIFFDTSTVLDTEAISELISTVGANRVLFGSDLPFGDEKTLLETYRSEIKAVKECKISPTEKNKVLSENFMKLFSSPKVICHHHIKITRDHPKYERS